MISKRQYKRLMSEYKQSDNIGESAMKSDVHRQTAKKYIEAGKPPAELQEKHDWRTRADPLGKIWSQAAVMLRDAPELEAKTLFEHFLAQPGSGLEESHLRTFQRRVRHWQATEEKKRGQSHVLTTLRRNGILVPCHASCELNFRARFIM